MPGAAEGGGHCRALRPRPCPAAPSGWAEALQALTTALAIGNGAAGPCLGPLPLRQGREEGQLLPLWAHPDPARPAAGAAGQEALQPPRNPPQEQPCAGPGAGPLSPSSVKSSHLHWVTPLSFVSHPPLPFSRSILGHGTSGFSASLGLTVPSLSWLAWEPGWGTWHSLS